MAGGTLHEHIAALKWIEDGTSDTKSNTRAELVDMVRKGTKGYVLDAAGNKAFVVVVEASPPYLRTKKDGVFTDNLLSLPTFI